MRHRLGNFFFGAGLFVGGVLFAIAMYEILDGGRPHQFKTNLSVAIIGAGIILLGWGIRYVLVDNPDTKPRL